MIIDYRFQPVISETLNSYISFKDR